MQALEFRMPSTGKPVKVNKFKLDFKLRFKDRVFVGKDINGLDFYVHKCEHHGYQIDYPHGYEERLDCAVCEFNTLVAHTTEREKRECESI